MTSPQHNDLSHDWEWDAQDAAFNGLCFALLPEGRLINANFLSADCSHCGPYDRHLILPDSFSISAERKRKAIESARSKQSILPVLARLTDGAAFTAANGAADLPNLLVAA